MFTRNAATFAVLAAPGLPAEDVAMATNTDQASAAVLDPKTVAWARATVAGLLTQHGLSSEQVDQRLSQLTDEDLVYLAQHQAELQEGGEEPLDYIWALLGVFLVVAIVATLL
jgi:hypothetical protein